MDIVEIELSDYEIDIVGNSGSLSSADTAELTQKAIRQNPDLIIRDDSDGVYYGLVGSCWCCEICGAAELQDCTCCKACGGLGSRPLLSGLEWNYIGPDYGECPDCEGTGKSKGMEA